MSYARHLGTGDIYFARSLFIVSVEKLHSLIVGQAAAQMYIKQKLGVLNYLLTLTENICYKIKLK
jgi:hypothetical protein